MNHCTVPSSPFLSNCQQILHFKCTSIMICLATFSRADHSWAVSWAFFLDANRVAYKTTRQISIWLSVGDSVVYSVRKKRTWISFPWEGHALRLIKAAICQISCSSLCCCLHLFFHGPLLETASLSCILCLWATIRNWAQFIYQIFRIFMGCQSWLHVVTTIVSVEVQRGCHFVFVYNRFHSFWFLFSLFGEFPSNHRSVAVTVEAFFVRFVKILFPSIVRWDLNQQKQRNLPNSKPKYCPIHLLCIRIVNDRQYISS